MLTVDLSIWTFPIRQFYYSDEYERHNLETTLLSYGLVSLTIHICYWINVMAVAFQRVMGLYWQLRLLLSLVRIKQEWLSSCIPKGSFLTIVMAHHLPPRDPLPPHIRNTHSAGDRCHRQCLTSAWVPNQDPLCLVKTENKILPSSTWGPVKFVKWEASAAKDHSPCSQTQGISVVSNVWLVPDLFSLLQERGHEIQSRRTEGCPGSIIF